MFLRRFDPPPDPEALRRLEALVRARYDVAEEDIVLVTEEEGRVPGYPERMTTILFWQGRDVRHRLRVFRPATDIGPGDLPPGWLKGALLDEGAGDCC